MVSDKQFESLANKPACYAGFTTTEKEVGLEKEIQVWKQKAKAAESVFESEHVLTKMLRRIFNPEDKTMRAKLHISGTKKQDVYDTLEKNRKWNIDDGSTFTLTCCKYCGHFFLEEDSVWPFPCEIAGEHEVFETHIDITKL